MEMHELETAFARAKEVNAKYIAVELEMEEYPAKEVIVNSSENFDKKLAYYKMAYNENCVHNCARPRIRIIKAVHGWDFEDLELALGRY